MRLKKIIPVCLISFGLLLWADAQEKKEEEKKIKNPLGKDRAVIGAGRELFQAGCAMCHGPTGQGGRGPRLSETPRVRNMPDKKIFDSIKEGIKGTEMPPSSLPDVQIWQLVSFIRSVNASAIDQEVPGDVAAGEALFFGTAKCSQCHMIRNRGGLLGPDLSNVGSNRSLEKLQQSLKDPSALIEPGFGWVTVQTHDGRRISGVAKNNSNYSIQIMDAQGNLHLLLKRELAEVIHHKKSLMPTPSLSETEMQNLLAFLSRQSLEPPAEASKQVEHGKELNP